MIRASWPGSFRRPIAQAEELWPVPASAGDCEGHLRQTGIGLAVPGKAIGQHRDSMHLAFPFARQHGARPQVRATPGQLHRTLPSVLRGHRMVEQTLALVVQVAQQVGLKPVSQNAKQKVAGEARVGPPPEYRMPTVSKVFDAEIT